MVILTQRRIITPKNIVLLGIILLSTYTYSTEFKLLSLNTFNPVAQLNSKFAQLKFDKLLIQSVESVESAKSFAGLKFKHVAKEYRSQEEQSRSQQKKASNLLKKYNSINNANDKLKLIDDVKTKILNTIVNSGNPFAYEILEKSNTQDVQNTVNLINALLKKNIDTSIQNKKGNTFTHLLLKKLLSLPNITLIAFKDSKDSIDKDSKDSIDTDSIETKNLKIKRYLPLNNLEKIQQQENYNTKKKDHESMIINGQHRNSFNIIIKAGEIEGYLTINNLDKMLQIKNNNNQAPLDYIANKFHPLALRHTTQRFLEEIRDKKLSKSEKLIGENCTTIQLALHCSNCPQMHYNDSNNILGKKNPIIKTFIQIPCDTPSNSIKVQIYPKELTTELSRVNKNLTTELSIANNVIDYYKNNKKQGKQHYYTLELLLKIKNYVKNYYWRKIFPQICRSVKKYNIPKTIINMIYSYAEFSILSPFSDIITKLNNQINNELTTVARDFKLLAPPDNCIITEKDFESLKSIATNFLLLKNNKK